MNSSTARDFLRANRRSNIHLYPDDWKKLPIPNATPAQQKDISNRVERILADKALDANADVSQLEQEIDELVANLYEPNNNEKNLIGIE